MVALLVDDDPQITAWLPGGAGAATTTVEVGRRVVVSDAVDMFGPWAWASAPLFADNVLLTATFDPATAKVVLTGTGLEPFTRVRFERSTNLVSWTTVRGGTSVNVANGTAMLDDYEFSEGVVNYYRMVTLAPFGQTSNVAMVVPMLDDVWLKSINRPFLNLRACVVQRDPLGIARTSRAGVLPIKGRTFPVAVNDIRLARRWTMYIRTETPAETEAVDLLLASGDVILIHVPTSARDVVPGGYVNVGDSLREHHPLRHNRITWTLPLTEVAPPGPFVVPAISTWASVVAAFATWDDVLAAFGSWQELVTTFVGSPAEVIVP